jgi:hypothetical protein
VNPFSRDPDRALSQSEPGGSGSGPGGLEGWFAGTTSPPCPEGGRVRLLAAAARAGLLDGPAPRSWLAQPGAGLALPGLAFGLRLAGAFGAAAAVALVASGLLAPTRDAGVEVARWRPLYSVPVPTPAVRVVDDGGDASLAFSPIDPLDTP